MEYVERQKTKGKRKKTCKTLRAGYHGSKRVELQVLRPCPAVRVSLDDIRFNALILNNPVAIFVIYSIIGRS